MANTFTSVELGVNTWDVDYPVADPFAPYIDRSDHSKGRFLERDMIQGKKGGTTRTAGKYKTLCLVA
jgi:hypothetical protein